MMTIPLRGLIALLCALNAPGALAAGQTGLTPPADQTTESSATRTKAEVTAEAVEAARTHRSTFAESLDQYKPDPGTTKADERKARKKEIQRNPPRTEQDARGQTYHGVGAGLTYPASRASSARATRRSCVSLPSLNWA